MPTTIARAAASFERARQIAPENLPANRGLVLSFLQMGRLREAIQIGREAVTRWPQRRATPALARTRLLQGRAERAGAGSSTAFRSPRRAATSTFTSTSLWCSLQQSQYPAACRRTGKGHQAAALACPGPRAAGTRLPEHQPYRAGHRAVSDRVAHRSQRRRSGTIIWDSLMPAWDAIRKRSRNTGRNWSALQTIRSFSTSSDTVCSKPVK